MKAIKFRKELMEIMPGYKWTVHRSSNLAYPERLIFATGIQTSGFNRLSTLEVIRSEKGETVEYIARSSGFGKRAPWLGEYTDHTLARSLRGLQDYYTAMANNYSRHAADLRNGREKE